ncbi:MAG TPA: hypothetical protein VHS31_04450 [Tepidisphaeraceae bacterium]|jgi:hypothetical protein|nr:hypothetical protein [Tepidisphaeraceae bacterium]
MLPADYAISRCRRDLTLAALIRYALMAGALFCLVIGPLITGGMLSSVILVAIGVLWITLTLRSARGSQMAHLSSSMIAAGQWDQAEKQIEQSLRSFSLFRSNKLLTLHHLALLRHAQNRYPESATICRALLGQRLGSLSGLNKSSRLMLADALLEMGDVRGAYDAFIRLHEQTLTLGEAVQLLVTEMDYASRIGAWDHILTSVMAKVQLAELMPAQNAAAVQAILALAAKKTGRTDLSHWLRRRVELLVDKDQLLAQRPVLKELFEEAVNT